MHPTLLMSAGVTAGLAVSLALRFVWAGVARRQGYTHWRDASAVNELLYIGGHCVFGACLGLLFWLSWGFTALIDLNWWQRGTAFGVIVALLFGPPPMLLMRSVLRVPSVQLWFWLCEVTLLGVAVGLNCSWHWQSAF